MPAVRILHIVGQMSRGGVETWLMQVLRHLDPARARMDFLVTRDEPGEFDAEIRTLGSEVIPCRLSRANPAGFALRFLATLRRRGPYDVVHSHVHHLSGFVLALARAASVPVRIAHSHMDTARLDAAATLPRRVYLRLTEAAVRRYATHGFAATSAAAAALFGARWRDDHRWAVARCGLDFSAFRLPAETGAIRAELGAPRDALVLGHVGRFDEFKNQILLVRMMVAVARRRPDVFLALVGDGPLRSRVEAEAVTLGVRQRVLFPGIRSDVPRILRAFDAFVFPSLHEGLPLVALEAQAAGLPIVLSDRVTRELVVLPDRFTWVSPVAAPETWAEAVLAAVAHRPPPADPVATLENSEFSLSRSLPHLLSTYGASG